ncbi:MAG: beta-ketoacyl-ACP synthase II, partial [Halobacteriovoraceae bacterium]|nr:beta-ketoacyl-ACP synthase II [Halobacteriovoraceae bacterium]
MNRVAITGMGIICGNGHTLPEVWENITAGKSGISRVEQIDTEKHGAKIGGEVKNFSLSEDYLPAKEHSRYDRFIHYAVHAGNQAWEHAGFKDQLPYPAEKIGAIMGIGMGGFPAIEANYKAFIEKGLRRVSPFFIPSVIPNMATGVLSISLGFKGLNYTISSACASAAHAMTAACYEIMHGRQDAMISGGAESTFADIPWAGFNNMKALSRRNDEPEKACRPFDSARDGFIMGEGSGVLILENLEKAKARGATIYGEVVGHGASSDAHHITAPHPDGEGAYRCMKMALEDAGIEPSAVGYVNAHGTSTPLGDI